VFVEQLARHYGLAYEVFQARLGNNASEDQARNVRYNFLRHCCKKYNAQEIITAHHQDDLVETMIINLLRGTGWRGLTSLSEISDHSEQGCRLRRPLLNTTKAATVHYAQKHRLQWREDSTNTDQSYLRNYIRHTLLPKVHLTDPLFNDQLLRINKRAIKLRNEIETELTNLTSTYQLPSTNSHLPSSIFYLPRHNVIMWPEQVAQEVIYAVLRTIEVSWHPSQSQIERLLHFIKSAQPGKLFEVNKHILVQVTLRGVEFKNTSDYGKINQ
jgi:tRNA(Ile)-lysidine synthase